MSKRKVLMARREDPEVESILKDAPPEVDIYFPAPGEALDDHLADAEIIYGGIREADLPKAKSLRWVQQPSAGVEGTMYPAFKASDVILTNCQKLYGLQISEHA